MNQNNPLFNAICAIEAYIHFDSSTAPFKISVAALIYMAVICYGTLLFL